MSSGHAEGTRSQAAEGALDGASAEGALADEADELFAGWLESRDSGAHTTLEELAGGRADLLAALRTLEALWQRFEAAGGVEAALQAGASGSTAFTPGAAETPASERYAVGREVGRGGMGVVFEVTDSQLHRRVAMKVVRTGGGAAGDRRLTRFLDEAQVTAQLEHPGIVPVHELGRDDEGRAYFTMALVEGETLNRVIERLHAKDPDWSLARALDVVAKVGDAVAYAHSRGVVHRDLKPDNVMVGRYGQVYVMDWGLARVASKRESADDAGPEARAAAREDLATDQPFLTHDGDVVGTPAYMPPEQAFGRVEEQGPRCDVYALGALLYHVLCGKPPYADRAEGVLVALRHGGPTPLLVLDSRIPRELVAIAELALRRDPARRYPDVAAFTMDLRAYLEGRVVGAFESGTLAQARKWVLRHRALTFLALAVLIVAAIAFASRLAQARVETLAERFMVLEELDDLERDAQGLWPVAPERRADFERYIARGERLAQLLPKLRADVNSDPEDRDAESDSAERRTRGWIEGKLRQTLARLEHFAEDEAGTLAHVRDRLARASAIERVERAHRLASNDLLPLGLDPHSGLALFEHLATAAPDRLEALLVTGAGDFAARAPGQGIVFVRLPSGLLYGRDEITLSQWSRLSDDMRRGDLPVTDITWIDALETLERSGLTLPDREQWLDAVAGGAEGGFGFDLPPSAAPEVLRELFLEREVLSRADDALQAPAEVGSRRPNRYGLFDTIGNVCEFLIDPFYSSSGLSRDRWSVERGLTRSVTTGFFRMRPEIEGDREILLTWSETSESASAPYLGVRAVVAR